MHDPHVRPDMFNLAGSPRAPSAIGRGLLASASGTSLFTYKVANDGGSAPNPFYRVCTLAICKPRIRAVAKRGDIVVGFGCKAHDWDEEFRVVYAMQVEEVLPWSKYIERCRQKMRGKIPDATSAKRYSGDCVYVSTVAALASPLESRSRHGARSFQKDVESGQNVLLARKYWYFGGGDRYSLILPVELRRLVPRAQGHRSVANKPLFPDFLNWFNQQIIDRGISHGVQGTPKDWPVGDVSGRDGCLGRHNNRRAS
jgi:hypothetical protein